MGRSTVLNPIFQEFCRATGADPAEAARSINKDYLDWGREAWASYGIDHDLAEDFDRKSHHEAFLAWLPGYVDEQLAAADPLADALDIIEGLVGSRPQINRLPQGHRLYMEPIRFGLSAVDLRDLAGAFDAIANAIEAA